MQFTQFNHNAGNVNNLAPGRVPGAGGSLSLAGEFLAELFSPEGELLEVERVANIVLDPSLTDILQVYFAGGSQKLSWRLGLIDLSNFTEVKSTDTMAAHAGWQENVNYSQGTRAAWTPSVGGGVASNAASQVFTFTRGTSLAGMFVCSDGVKGGTTGQLWSAAVFGQPKAYSAGQTVRLSYALRAAGGG